MSKTYRLSPLAEADLEDIWLYTFQNWSITQADSYHRDLIATFEALVNGMKPGRPSVLPDYQKCLCGSHVVYFLDYPDRVDIIRILHQRQDADQHL